MKIITIHDGKGQKDRTLPMPDTLLTALHDQVANVVQQYEQDLVAGYAGTFLPTALADKYKNAAKELVWQWLFPAKMLTLVPSTNEYRRYHLHETPVQKAIKLAVRNQPIYFSGISNIAATLNFQANAGATPPFTGNNGTTLMPIFGGSVSENPTTAVESPEGTSSSGAHGTVREPLDSYGSSYPVNFLP